MTPPSKIIFYLQLIFIYLDAQAAANWIFTGNMDCPPGRTVYTCMLNKMAGIEADLTVSVLESGEGGSVDPEFTGTGFYIAAAGGAAYQNLSHIQKTVQVLQQQKF